MIRTTLFFLCFMIAAGAASTYAQVRPAATPTPAPARTTPQPQPQAPAVYERAVDVAEAELKWPDAPAWKFATVGSLKRGQQKWDVAERYYARALALDSSQESWRLQHARALAQLGRFDEAIREAQTEQRMFPGSKEAKELLDSLLKPHP